MSSVVEMEGIAARRIVASVQAVVGKKNSPEGLVGHPMGQDVLFFSNPIFGIEHELTIGKSRRFMPTCCPLPTFIKGPNVNMLPEALRERESTSALDCFEEPAPLESRIMHLAEVTNIRRRLLASFHTALIRHPPILTHNQLCIVSQRYKCGNAQLLGRR
jgi:hypothetical protein